MLQAYRNNAILHSNPTDDERKALALQKKGMTDVPTHSLTHQGSLIIGHSPQGHHTALPGANSNTDLVRLQGIA